MRFIMYDADSESGYETELDPLPWAVGHGPDVTDAIAQSVMAQHSHWCAELPRC